MSITLTLFITQFFFKATLLQQVDELLQTIIKQLKDAFALVDELETLIRPIQLELSELQEKIKNMERVEEISREVQQLKKKLAWSWVYDVDRQLQEQGAKIEKLKDRIPTCQAKIDSILVSNMSYRKHVITTRLSCSFLKVSLKSLNTK